MKKTILMALIATLALASFAQAETCNPAEVRPVLMEKITNLQKSPEKFAKIDASLHEALARIPALQEAGNLEAICKELDGMIKMVDEAAK